MSAYETILTERDGEVVKITLDRPERMNAWTWQMSVELSHAFNTLDADDSVRAIVVTGSGRAFCAGADLAGGGETFSGRSDMAKRGGPNDRDHWLEVFPGPHLPVRRLNTPVIAAINGAAVGAGLTMPVEWDIRYVAEDAKLGFVFNRRGVIPDADLLWFLPRLIGFSRAFELLLTGRMFSGSYAAEIGLATEAVPGDAVLDLALDAARDIAANTSPVTAAVTKRLAYEFLGSADWEASARRQAELFVWSGRQADAAEGVMSFVEKRPPDWKLSKNADLPESMRQ